ncbi:FAD-binding protein [Candidatus Pseudothioglobus singularis]|nr:FAD-binding protein [Candidatus Pseudothioglobus singularis]
MIEKLNHLEISYKSNLDLKKSSYFQTGGIINLAIYPDTIDKFLSLVAYLSAKKYKYSVFGWTSNCIFKKDTNLEIVIFSTKMRSLTFDNFVYAEAGVMLPKMCNILAKASISGFEELQGIPATLGGAIYMNAGCYGNEISRNLISVTILTKQGHIKEMKKNECNFGYRYSIFHEIDAIILSAKFKKNKGEKNALQKKILELHNHRHFILEYDYRNVGSVFVTHDIYSDLAKKNLVYRFILFFIRFFIHKIFRVKTNSFLNSVTFSFFGLNRYINIVSIKTMNVLINNNTDTRLLEEYINDVKSLTDNRVEIELI